MNRDYNSFVNRWEDATNELADRLALQDEIQAIQNWWDVWPSNIELSHFQGMDRIVQERWVIWNRIQAMIEKWELPREWTWDEIKTKQDVRRLRILDAIAHQMKEYYELDKIAWVENLSISEDGTVVSYTYLWFPITVTLIWWNKVEHSWESVQDIEKEILQKAWVITTRNQFWGDDYEIWSGFASFLWFEATDYVLFAEGWNIAFNFLKKSDIVAFNDVPRSDSSLWTTFFELVEQVRANDEYRKKFLVTWSWNLPYQAYLYSNSQ